MNIITQTMKFRQALIEYSLKYGVTKAAIRYKTNRQYIYRWRKQYDGTLQSLADKSHKPHHHPNEHTPDELKLIENMRKRNPNAGLVVFWVKLRQRGYTRSVTGLYRTPAHLGQIERALKKPTVETVDKIAAALGVSFAELFSFGTTPTDQSDAVTNKINAYLSSMSESEKKDILRIIRIFKHFDNSQTTKND